MTAYRLTFLTSSPMIATMADALAEAPITLGEVIGTIANGAEVLGQNYLTSHHGVTQFQIRFAAESDAVALAVSNAALREVSQPLDSVKIERRSKRYEPVGG